MTWEELEPGQHGTKPNAMDRGPTVREGDTLIQPLLPSPSRDLATLESGL